MLKVSATQNQEVCAERFQRFVEQFRVINEIKASGRLLYPKERLQLIHPFFNLIDNMLRLILTISQCDSQYRDGAIILKSVYQAQNKAIMSSEFTEDQQTQVQKVAYQIKSVNDFVEAQDILKNSKLHEWHSILATVYKLDSLSAPVQLTASERVIRQWFTLQTRIQPKLISKAHFVIGLHRVYQQQQDVVITNEIGLGAVREVINFFDWVLFSMNESNFSSAKDQNNPEEGLSFLQFVNLVLLTTKAIQRESLFVALLPQWNRYLLPDDKPCDEFTSDCKQFFGYLKEIPHGPISPEQFNNLTKLIQASRSRESKDEVFKMVLKNVRNHLTVKQHTQVDKLLSTDPSVQGRIITICKAQAPSDEKMQSLWMIKKRVKKQLIQNNFMPGLKWELIIYGSTLNSVCSNDHSDLDITLIVQSELCQVEILRMLQAALTDTESSLLLLPSGPLLQFVDLKTKTEVDITVNKVLEIQNSRLIRAYAQLDHRFSNLAVVLKLWNKNLFSNKMTRINSYTLNLMLIAYLQHERVLPSLQALAETKQYLKYEQQGKYLSYQSIAEVQFYQEQLKTDNNGPNEHKLLIGFFNFYGCLFDKATYAIDIRSGSNPFPLRSEVLQEIKQKFKGHPQEYEILQQQFITQNQRLLFMVVDPFKLDYCPAKIFVDSETAHEYQQRFEEAIKGLKKGRLLDQIQK